MTSVLFSAIVELAYLPADSRCVSECLIHETVLFPILDTLHLSVAILPSIAVTLPDFDSMNFGEWTTSALSLNITLIQYRININPTYGGGRQILPTSCYSDLTTIVVCCLSVSQSVSDQNL